MKNKLSQSIPFLFTLFGIIFAPVSYWCVYSNKYCYGSWIHNIYQYFTNPLYNFSIYFLPIAIILIFVSRSTFNSWLKLAVWVLPVSFIYIATTHVTSSAFMDPFPFYRDDAARLAGTAFSLASLLLVIWKYIASRQKDHLRNVTP